MNVHFAYDDEDAKVRHQVWFLDAVTVLNEMRAARALGIQTFALWRLGSEDNSLWSIWDCSPHRHRPRSRRSPPSTPVTTSTPKGEGDILRIVAQRPQAGNAPSPSTTTRPRPRREYRSIIDESMDSYPAPYTVEQYGYHPKKVALSFDDGPDREWTPKHPRRSQALQRQAAPS